MGTSRACAKNCRARAVFMTPEQLAHFQTIAMEAMYQRQLVAGWSNGQVDSPIAKTVFHFAIEPDRFSVQIIIG